MSFIKQKNRITLLLNSFKEDNFLIKFFSKIFFKTLDMTN